MSQRLLSWRRAGIGRADTRIHYQAPGASQRLADAFSRILSEVCTAQTRGLVFVCIGTDRSTGDALGPMVGRLMQHLVPPEVVVLGTLEEPVHAGNLMDRLNGLDLRYPDHAVVAIDACLGKLENVGTISVGRGSLQPGAGVNKQLPAVGDCFVTGTVNVGGFMEYFVLQNTRLSLVVQMAEVMSAGLLEALTGSQTALEQTGATRLRGGFAPFSADVASTRDIRPRASDLPH